MVSENKESSAFCSQSKLVLRLSWQVSGFISMVVSAAVAWLIMAVPVKTDLSAFEGVLLPSVLENCKPERDIVGYAAFAVLFPLLHTVFIHVFRKRFAVSSKNVVRISRVADILWSSACAVFAFAMVGVFYLYSNYADKYLFGRNKFPLAVVCTLFVFAVCLMYRRKRMRTANEIAAVVLGAAFLVLVMYAVGKYNYMLSYSTYNLHHYSAWWNPVYKVGSGLTLGDGFNELYGFYPYLIVPVLKLFGGVNQQSLSAYMSLVFAIMAACMLGFCYRFFKNKLLGVICAIGFFTLGPLSYFGNAEVYFQYYPTRALFTFLILGLIAVYCTVKKFHRLLMVLGAVLCTLALIWNTESGAVTTVVWAGFLILEKALFFRFTDKELLKRIAFAVLSSLISFVLFVAVIESVTYSRAGVLLGKDDILFGIVTFSGAGFYMLPLKLGVWVAVAAALAYGLYSSVPHLAFARCKGEEFFGDKDSVIALFMSSVAGIGSFMYFMGRSFSTNCMTFLPWVVLICSLLADRNMSLPDSTECSDKSVSGKVLTAAKNTVCFTVAGIALCSAVTMTGNVFRPDSKINTLFNCEQTDFADAAAQINEWKDEKCGGKTPYVFLTYSAFVQENMGVPAAENVYEQINWFHYDDAYSYIRFINEHTDTPFVMDYSGVFFMKQYFPEEWEKIKETYVCCERSERGFYIAYGIPNSIYLFCPVEDIS